MDLSTRAGRREQGRRIQHAAEEAGLSLEELAREIGCSRALIYQYVSGGVPAQPVKLQKIAQRSRRPLSYFYEDARDGELAALPDPEDAADAAPATPEALTTPLTRSGESPASRDVPTRSKALPVPDDSQLRPEASRAELVLPYLEELADSQEAHGDWSGLLSSCERIVPFARELGDLEAEARAWLRIGNARIQRGHHDQALPALRIALQLFDQLGNDRLALSCRQSLGSARLAAGDVAGAMAEFQRVASGPSWMNRWQGAVSLSATYEQQGDYQRALSECEAALEIIGSPSAESEAAVEAARCYVISNQANVYLSCGDFQNAAALSRELLLTAERVNQRDQFIEALINLSVCDLYRAEWVQARNTLSRAIDLSRFSDDTPRRGLAQAWLASVLCHLGQPEKAKAEAKDSLRIGIETASRRCEVQAQIALGEAYLRTAAPQESLYHLDQAVASAKSISSVAQISLALVRRSAAHAAVGAVDAALSDAEGSLRVGRSHGIQHVEVMALAALARLGSDRGNTQQALALVDEALKAAAQLGMLDTRWRLHALRAALLDRQGGAQNALDEGREAIRQLNELRSHLLLGEEEERLLEEPDAFGLFKDQLSRLRSAGLDDERSRLLQATAWPPLDEDNA